MNPLSFGSGIESFYTGKYIQLSPETEDRSKRDFAPGIIIFKSHEHFSSSSSSQMNLTSTHQWRFSWTTGSKYWLHTVQWLQQGISLHSASDLPLNRQKRFMIDRECIPVMKYSSIIVSHLMALLGNKEMNKVKTKMHHLANPVPHHYRSVVLIIFFFIFFPLQRARFHQQYQRIIYSLICTKMSLLFMVLYKTEKTTSCFQSGELHKLFYCATWLREITTKEGGKSGDVFHLIT